MNEIISNHTTKEIPKEQIIGQLEKLIASKQFCQTRNLGKFLQHIVRKTVAGEESDLKESLLGREVFLRGENFDPAKDSVVRVQAIALRKKLTTYYEEEGFNDEVVITLPKGHYVPVFSSHQAQNNALAVLPTDQAVFQDSITVRQATYTPPPRWKAVGTLALYFALGLITTVLLQSWYRDGQSKSSPMAEGKPLRGAIDPSYAVLWDKFLQPNADNILAFGTPQFFVANGVFLRDVEVNSPEEFSDGTRLKALQATLQNKLHTELRPTETYTGVGETQGIYLLSRFLLKTALEPKVTSTRMIRWNEMKNSNVIFLSSMRFHTLAKELPFPNDFVIKAGNAGQIVNLHPLEGEKSVYGRTAEDPINDYAVITLWPGKSNQQRVLVLSGNTTYGTLAAAEYVTDPEYLRQLYGQIEQCRLKQKKDQHSPFFQVLVRAEVKENQPYKITYVTHHDLAIPEELNLTNQTATNR
ncbi:MAG: hypothetical protein JST84_02155 [Acidobacteria bacterium]|nr:hypothetical protein [Acidobacteriota bacterium]